VKAGSSEGFSQIEKLVLLTTVKGRIGKAKSKSNKDKISVLVEIGETVETA